MKDDMLKKIDSRIVADLYMSRAGARFVEDIVENYGSRFGGTDEERGAAEYIAELLSRYGVDKSWKEEFTCQGWTRKSTTLKAVKPVSEDLDCIALPFCPPARIEAPLVYLGDGDPQAYADNRERLKGAIAMVSTATPRFYHRAMHRGEKLGRALEAGAVGFIWMRGEPGGLPETGSARFNRACEVPAISVSYETGHRLLRLARKGEVVLGIDSTNTIQETTSYNVVGEIKGRSRPDEVIVLGAHYDGHDISQSANDDAAGTAVVLEAARALAPHRDQIDRTVRFVAFAQEEMGLIGSENYVQKHADENFVFMVNLDGAGRGGQGSLTLQGWSEATSFFRDLLKDMHEEHITVGDRIGLYSDMYPFAARGFPAATYWSAEPATGGAPRGWGHTSWDSLDKINPRAIQLDSIAIARLTLRLSTADSLPFERKDPAEIGTKLKDMGLDEVLRYELRSIPGDE